MSLLPQRVKKYNKHSTYFILLSLQIFKNDQMSKCLKQFNKYIYCARLTKKDILRTGTNTLCKKHTSPKTFEFCIRKMWFYNSNKWNDFRYSENKLKLPANIEQVTAL